VNESVCIVATLCALVLCARAINSHVSTLVLALEQRSYRCASDLPPWLLAWDVVAAPPHAPAVLCTLVGVGAHVACTGEPGCGLPACVIVSPALLIALLCCSAGDCFAGGGWRSVLLAAPTVARGAA